MLNRCYDQSSSLSCLQTSIYIFHVFKRVKNTRYQDFATLLKNQREVDNDTAITCRFMLLIFSRLSQVRNSVRFAGKSRLNSERFQDVNILSHGLPCTTGYTKKNTVAFMNASFRKKWTPFLEDRKRTTHLSNHWPGVLAVYDRVNFKSLEWESSPLFCTISKPGREQGDPPLPCLAQWVGSLSCPRVGSIHPRSPPVALGC